MANAFLKKWNAEIYNNLYINAVNATRFQKFLKDAHLCLCKKNEIISPHCKIAVFEKMKLQDSVL